MALGVAQIQVQARATGTSLTYNNFDPAAGSLIVVDWSTWYSGGNPNNAVTDSVNGAYTSAITKNGDANSWIGVHYKENVATTVCNITLTPAGSADLDLCIAEVTGAATSLSLDKTNTASATNNNPPTVATGVLSQANEILIGVMSHTGTSMTALAVGAGFTIIGENENNATGQCYNAEYKIVSSTEDSNVTWTTGAHGGTWFCLVGTFKEAAGGGSIPGNPFRKPFIRPFGGIL